MAFSLFRKSAPKPESAPNAAPGYRNLTVREVIRETPDAVRVVFERSDPPLSYKAGQFITLIPVINGKEERRSYSLCSSPVTDEFPAIGIKRVASGKVSSWSVEHLKAGDSIRIMDPMGNFTLEMNAAQKRHVVMIAGGSGITPMMALTKTVLAAEPESQVTLIYGNRDEAGIMFRDELDSLVNQNAGRLVIHHILENPPAGWNGFQGYLTGEVMASVSDLWSKQGLSVPDVFMLCGPEPMMNAASTILSARGIAADRIRKESFTPSSAPKAAAVESADVAHDVVIRYDGQEFRIRVEPGKAILETALNQGIDLPYSCQSGLCTACRGKAISGKVKLDEEDGLSKSEREEGYVLTCVGHPLTDDVVIEIG